MAKRRSKKGRHGRHRKRRMSAKQRRAAIRNLKKARKALRRGKRRKGGKRRKSRKGRKKSKRRSSKRRRRSGGGSRLSNKAHQVYQTLIDRGRTPAQAHKVAARIDRMRTGKVKRYFEREAMQAKTKSALSNLFSGFGAAGHLAHQTR